MLLATPIPHGAPEIRAIFGPAQWQIKAARILGVKPRHVLKLFHGEKPVTRRQRAIIATYAANRRQAFSAETKIALERTAKRQKAALQALIAAQAVLQAKAAERQRQGRL